MEAKLLLWCKGCDDIGEMIERTKLSSESEISCVFSHNDVELDADDQALNESFSSNQKFCLKDFRSSDLGKCLHFVVESLNQVSTVEEIINQWEVFHQSVEDRIEHAVKQRIDKLLIVFSSPFI
eukprot:750463-Hanusia_phi.AAC.7